MPAIVAHLITKLELGGAQQNTLFTVANLDRERFRPVLITGEPGILDAEARALPGVPFYQVPHLVRSIRPLKDIQALLSLTRLLASIKPEIVHTHSSKAGILGRVAAWLAGVPVIIHSIHGFGFTPYQHPWARRALVAAERRVARFTTRFFAVSEANRRLGMELGLFSAERSTVIRSGIDREHFLHTIVDRGRKRQELGLEPTGPLIGMVATLKPQKAPLDFVRVAASVHKSRPEARFVLVGDGELRGAVEAERERLGLSEVFRLLGWRRDVAEVLRCLDVFVLTSLWEGLPRVYAEARAVGLPVVGTCVDGAAEIIEHGINGFLTAPGDVPALAEHVKDLLDHPEKGRKMGQDGPPLPIHYDIREMVLQQEREYEHLLARNAAEGRVQESAACGVQTGEFGD